MIDARRLAGCAGLFIFATSSLTINLQQAGAGGLKSDSQQNATVQKASPIQYDGHCFTIFGRDMVIYSGAFHYFRCPKALWRDRLQKIKDANFNTVETYIAWNWHERREGQIDLKDFEDFLKLCEQMGLFVIARPGPYICAEWDAGGFPSWLPGKVTSLRDNSADSVKWSKHWFDAVLPVIQRHQLTRNGSIILCQLENEYDYHPGVSDSEKKEYVRSLFKMAKEHGIDVPLITCWTRQVRDRKDPDMRQIMDSDNFYVNWNVGSTVGQLAKLGKEQPDAPKMVTELQGGWFSNIGGKLSVDQEGITPEQENALIKTVWAGGATATNYYMLFGGTNFGYWGSKGMTTTYDYAAPIREPGGLWDKYYVVRAAGWFAKVFGPVLARSEMVTEGVSTEMPGVSVIERANGTAGFLFLRNDSDKARDGLVTAVDPATKKSFDIAVHLEPRGAKILPINANFGLITVRRTNAEITGIHRVGKKTMLTFAGDPGESLQVSFGGASVYSEVGPGVGVSLPSDPLLNPDQMIEAPNGVLAFFTTAARSSRMSEVRTDRRDFWPVYGGFYGLGIAGATEDRMSFDAEVTAGKYDVSVPLPRKATHVKVNGQDVPFTMTPGGLAQFHVESGIPDLKAVPMGAVKVSKEMWGGGGGWKPIDLRPLDELGINLNGYTRYRTLFTWKGEKELVLNQFAGDPVLVAVNGTPMPVSAEEGKPIRIDLTRAAKSGINRLEVLYENAGRPNFGGPSIWERKGLKSAMLLAERGVGVSLDKWRFHKGSDPAETSPEAATEFNDSSWKSVGIGNEPELNGYKRWAWYRTTLNVSPSDLSQGRTILQFESVDDNAVVFINGKKIAENKGWNNPFNIDINRLVQAGPNTIAVAVQNTDGPGGITKPVTLTSPEVGEPLKGWEIADRLLGQLRGWMKNSVAGAAFTKITLPERRIDRSNTVRWYRTSFRLPEVGSTRFRGPWKLKLEAGGEAQIYVNGYPIGKYSDRGPQSEFYLPEPWLRTGKLANIVAIALRDGSQPAALKHIEVAPYGEYSTRKVPVTIEF